MTAFHKLLANTLVVVVANSFLWFALTFWVYLETRSVMATAIVGGSYMLLVSVCGIFFGSIVDHHLKRTAMVVSSLVTFVCFGLAFVHYQRTPDEELLRLSSVSFWAFVLLVLFGAIAGNVRGIAIATLVTHLVPEDRRDKANGLFGTINGLGYAITSVFSGLAVGQLGMGWSLAIAVVLTALAVLHLIPIHFDEPPLGHHEEGGQKKVDLRGTIKAINLVPGLMALIFFATFNNFLGGVFMALMDPYGLNLVSVEVWGFIWGALSFAYIFGGIVVASKGLGPNPLRTLLLINVVMWAVCILFPLRSSIVMLVAGCFVYMVLIPPAEAAEQTIIQKVVPQARQGRVFGFAQSVETAASPVTAFLIGPVAQYWVIPEMTNGSLASAIGSWFGTGPDRGMALVFVVAGTIGLIVAILAMNSRSYRLLSGYYMKNPDPEQVAGPVEETR